MRILFFGTPEFSAKILEALLGGSHPVVGVVSLPSRPRGRGLLTEEPPAIQLAKQSGLPAFQPARLHAEETLARFRALEPDLLVTAAFGRILRASLLALAPRGSWNVHASVLPRHRGASPVTAAILAGDAWTGITLFRMDEGMDTGPLLLQEVIPIEPHETAGALMERLAELGGRVLRAGLDREAEGSLTAVPQPRWGATITRLLVKEDGRIPWNRPPEQVERWVRAMNPWPGAFSRLGEERLRLHAVTPVHRMPMDLAPGTLITHQDSVLVACLPGAVRLDLVQSEGKKRQDAATWVRGQRLPTGTRLE